ncbi:hypothetical protein RB195_000674 [Necator americanus]|uniref:Uncharacterized protein n=1 Tax=Necator americanus TaxID=51031 RepID=A0ABR1DAU1_NECAM
MRMLPVPDWKEPTKGHKRNFLAEVIKEFLRILGVDRQFSRDVELCRLHGTGGLLDSVRDEDRTGSARICLRTTHADEDEADGRVRP